MQILQCEKSTGGIRMKKKKKKIETYEPDKIPPKNFPLIEYTCDPWTGTSQELIDDIDWRDWEDE